MTVRFEEFTVEWLGYATARLSSDAGPVAYTDPGRYGVLDDYWARDGDVVVVTHDHHYDPDGIRSVAAADATIVVYDGVDPARIDRDVEPVDALAADYDVARVGPEDRVDVETPAGAVAVWSVPAHNDPDGPNAAADGSVTHPPGFGCGYLLSLGGRTVFWPGDSDALDGFAELEVSVFLANIGGGGVVSDRVAAADLADAMDPDLVVPIHYDTVDALAADDEAFAGDVASRSIPVALDARSRDR